MLYWAAVFFVIAIVAAIFGFGEIVLAAVAIAKVLFWLSIIGFLISLIFGLAERRKAPKIPPMP